MQGDSGFGVNRSQVQVFLPTRLTQDRLYCRLDPLFPNLEKMGENHTFLKRGG